MAAITRQPFAPLDGARLSDLISGKNRQNAVNTVSKRKADLLANDWENIAPAVFNKRSKGIAPCLSIAKPSSFALNTHFSSATLPDILSVSSPVRVSTTRQTLMPKSQRAKLDRYAAPTPTPVAAAISAPAGRSPKAKRTGLLSSRRHPPASLTGSAKAKPWSVDGALKSTMKPTNRHGKSKSRLSRGKDMGSKAAWFFEIHEDTPEQEMTNLLQHSTCTLDISSDEETSAKAKRDRDDGCDKENVPPPGYVAQAPPAAPRSSAKLSKRAPLAELDPRDFYAEGCDETSVFLVDEDEETEVEDNSTLIDFEFAPKLGNASLDPILEKLDELVEKPAEGSAKAAVLEPIEGIQDNFELWESGSAKDEAEATV
ncbi:hypothetical protein MY11210_008688 [Beauveria gryllotalpidicola]